MYSERIGFVSGSNSHWMILIAINNLRTVNCVLIKTHWRSLILKILITSSYETTSAKAWMEFIFECPPTYLYFPWHALAIDRSANLNNNWIWHSHKHVQLRFDVLVRGLLSNKRTASGIFSANVTFSFICDFFVHL